MKGCLGAALLIALVATLFLTGPIGAQPPKPKRSPIAWSEVADALQAMPIPKKRSAGRYVVSPDSEKRFEAKIAALKARGDIIPAIVDRLKRKPKTETDEAETLHLVQVLRDNPDERALPVLEQLAASRPNAAWGVPDEGGGIKYPYNRIAREGVDAIRTELARAALNQSLSGKSAEDRRKAIAEILWSPSEVERFRLNASRAIADAELSPDQRVADIEGHLSPLLGGDSQWKHDSLNRASLALSDAGKAGASRTKVSQLLERITAEGGTKYSRDYASIQLKALKDHWREIDAPR